LNLDDAYQSSDLEFELGGGNGIYHLSWPQLHIEADVNRLRETHDHEVKAEVMITSARPTSAGHLRQGRINLTSTASRKTMAKSLQDRDPDVDWDKVMEQLSVAVLSDWRIGSPETLLEGQVDIQAQPKWVIEPFVQLRNITLIHGAGGVGKSWLAQYLAVLLDAGVSHSGLHVEPSRVLYLDWETDESELAARVTMIRNGLGLEGTSHIWYKSMYQGLANDIENLRAVVANRDIDVVIVDSIGSACAGEPESAEVVLRFSNALKSLRNNGLKVSSICIDHNNKEGGLFGSVYKYTEARIVYEVRKAQDPDQDKLMVGMFPRKANNGRMGKEVGFEFRFDATSMTVTRRDVHSSPELEQHLRVVDRIRAALSRGAMGVKQLTRELETPEKRVSESHVRKVLWEGQEKGLISKSDQRSKDGEVLYSLPAWERVDDPTTPEEEQGEWVIS
jgi:hypothetical protein